MFPDAIGHGSGLGFLFETGRQATLVNFVRTRKPPAAPAGSFLAKQQLSKTSSPDIANGGGMETETGVQSGPTDPNDLGASPSFLSYTPIID